MAETIESRTAAKANVGAQKLLTGSEARDFLGIGQTKFWELTSRGELPVIRVGRSVRVAQADLEEFVQRNRSVSK